MTIYLLDTNVVSETAAARPDPAVLSWLRGIATADIRISALTIGELVKGIATLRRKGSHAKADILQGWFDALPYNADGAVVPIDTAIARRWGELAGLHPMLPPVDGLIAATAVVHGFTLATRNVRDVAQTGVAVLNPWEA